jgi:preprotein translocase SecE subunit
MDIKNYLSEVRAEVRKVSWPSKQKTIKDSILVIAASLVTAAFMGGADALFSYLAQRIMMR